jgi:hypothetical protein
LLAYFRGMPPAGRIAEAAAEHQVARAVRRDECRDRVASYW